MRRAGTVLARNRQSIFQGTTIQRSNRSRAMTVHGSVDWKATWFAAIVAGVVSTAFQLLLWWLAGQDPVALLLRDTRLAAAIVMGPSVLAPSATFDAVIMIVATLLHFALSFAYAVVLAWMLARTGLRGIAAGMAGAVFGIAIFVMNMYGFTWLFPWFVQTRDAITLAAHIVFGLSLAQAYVRARYDDTRAGSALHNNKGEHR
jgi:hypothetical protein